jgi:hypothetical protein
MHNETYKDDQIKEVKLGKNVACIGTARNILFRNAIRQEASWETLKMDWNMISAGPYSKIV